MIWQKSKMAEARVHDVSHHISIRIISINHAMSMRAMLVCRVPKKCWKNESYLMEWHLIQTTFNMRSLEQHQTSVKSENEWRCRRKTRKHRFRSWSMQQSIRLRCVTGETRPHRCHHCVVLVRTHYCQTAAASGDEQSDAKWLLVKFASEHCRCHHIAISIEHQMK